MLVGASIGRAIVKRKYLVHAGHRLSGRRRSHRAGGCSRTIRTCSMRLLQRPRRSAQRAPPTVHNSGRVDASVQVMVAITNAATGLMRTQKEVADFLISYPGIGILVSQKTEKDPQAPLPRRLLTPIAHAERGRHSSASF
jgi:hypothetical protein